MKFLRMIKKTFFVFFIIALLLTTFVSFNNPNEISKIQLTSSQNFLNNWSNQVNYQDPQNNFLQSCGTGGFCLLVDITDEVFTSTNYGNSWTPVSRISNSSYSSLGSSLTCWGTSDCFDYSGSSYSYLTTNAGLSWSQEPAVPGNIYNQALTCNSYTCIDLSGGNQIFYSTNAGLTWNTDSISSGTLYASVTCNSYNVCAAIGCAK